MPLIEGDEAPQQDPPNPLDGKIAVYVNEITLYERETRTWKDRSKKILRRYKDERSPRENTLSRFNILWSMVQTLQPAIYAKDPKPDIERRFKDDDAIGRVTSDVLERAVTYYVQTQDFSYIMKQCVKDYLLLGRGTSWIRYIPHMEPLEDGPQVTDDMDDKLDTVEQIIYEEAKVDFVNSEDFGHNICRTWEEVWCVWRKAYMTRPELKDRFGSKAKDIPLDYKLKTTNDTTLDDGTGKATIYELWDEKRKAAIWFHKDIPDALDIRDDPLKLEEFFPCPRPLYTNLANDSLVPIPDYVQYQDQAAELDNLTSRIQAITKSLKVAGVYDASAQGLSRLLAEGVENQLIPVESWGMFAEKGGIKGAMDLLPLDMISSALLTLYEARDKTKDVLYEITGIADIIRGESDPQETASAQQIKSNFATLRLSDKQYDVQRFVRDVIRLMTNIIANHFSIDTIKQVSGVRLLTSQEKAVYQQASQPSQPALPSPSGAPAGTPPPQPPMPPLPQGMTMDQVQELMTEPTWEDVEQLIRNQPMRCFRIDIETDSIIKQDEQQDRQARVEFLKAAGGFLQQATEAGQQNPKMIPLFGRMLMFGIKGFPIGKELEGAFNAAIQEMEKEAQNPQPKPNPEMMKIQGDLQLQQQKMQGDQQIEQAKAQGAIQVQQAQLQGDLQSGAAKLQQEKDLAQYKMQMEAQTDQHENQLEAQRKSAEMAQELELSKLKLSTETQVELEKAHIQSATAIEVARINAKATVGADAESREASNEGVGDVPKEEDMPPQEPPTPPEPDPKIAEMHQHVGQMGQVLTNLAQHAQAHTQAMSALLKNHRDSHQQMMEAMTSEKELVRDPKTGKAAGVRLKPKKAGANP